MEPVVNLTLLFFLSCSVVSLDVWEVMDNTVTFSLSQDLPYTITDDTGTIRSFGAGNGKFIGEGEFRILVLPECPRGLNRSFELSSQHTYRTIAYQVRNSLMWVFGAIASLVATLLVLRR